MPKGLNALVIAPMGKGKEKEEPMAEEPEGDGTREAFDEFKAAMDAGDSDAAYEALKNFTEMCAMKAGDY
jgi:hypothetical protein